jgi:hypothetical protein
MHEPIVGPLDPVNPRNELAGLHSRGAVPKPDVENAVRAKLATAKIDKAIRQAMEVCPVPLHRAQVEYLCGLIESGGEEK